jgi:hypothetical protein
MAGSSPASPTRRNVRPSKDRGRGLDGRSRPRRRGSPAGHRTLLGKWGGVRRGGSDPWGRLHGRAEAVKRRPTSSDDSARPKQPRRGRISYRVAKAAPAAAVRLERWTARTRASTASARATTSAVGCSCSSGAASVAAPAFVSCTARSIGPGSSRGATTDTRLPSASPRPRTPPRRPAPPRGRGHRSAAGRCDRAPRRASDRPVSRRCCPKSRGRSRRRCADVR